MLRDSEARKVCTPYHATAMMPRMTAGMLAPLTPKTKRMVTGNGTPVRWLGLATRLTSAWTMMMPTIRQMNTCQLAMPSANRLPAVTYPPTEWTSDIQNAKMLYQLQLCLRSGARSLLASRGSYPGLIRVSSSLARVVARLLEGIMVSCPIVAVLIVAPYRGVGLPVWLMTPLTEIFISVTKIESFPFYCTIQ